MHEPVQLNWNTAELVARINAWLETVLTGDPDAPDGQQQLYAAMRYAVLGGGKRVRPLLVYAAGQLWPSHHQLLDAAAAAVEMVHCYSLVHDDLPAMDDDDLRRGQPTLHRHTDEATAILAGDALLSRAFQCLSSIDMGANNTADISAASLACVRLLGEASGGAGMVGGQMLDIEMAGKQPSIDALETMFSMKTGALIHASVMLGAYASVKTPDARQLQQLDTFGRATGLCFQVQDDILDVIGDTEVIGKPQGSDAAKDKPNYALRYGLDKARQRADGLFSTALQNLEGFGSQAEPLRQMAAYITRRDY